MALARPRVATAAADARPRCECTSARSKNETANHGMFSASVSALSLGDVTRGGALRGRLCVVYRDPQQIRKPRRGRVCLLCSFLSSNRARMRNGRREHARGSRPGPGRWAWGASVGQAGRPAARGRARRAADRGTNCSKTTRHARVRQPSLGPASGSGEERQQTEHRTRSGGRGAWRPCPDTPQPTERVR